MFEDADFIPDSVSDDTTIHTKNLELTISKLEDSNKALLSILCDTCLKLDQGGFDFDTVPKLNEWWSKHKEKERQLNADKTNTKMYLDSLVNKPLSSLSIQEKFVLQKYGLY
jgi:hypothetical protein